jgi:hypothetical protein
MTKKLEMKGRDFLVASKMAQVLSKPTIIGKVKQEEKNQDNGKKNNN